MGGCESRIGRMRRGVDNGEFGTGITCCSEQGGQLGRVPRDDGGGIGEAETSESAIESVPAEVEAAEVSASLTGDENSTDKDTSVVWRRNVLVPNISRVD